LQFPAGLEGGRRGKDVTGTAMQGGRKKKRKVRRVFRDRASGNGLRGVRDG